MALSGRIFLAIALTLGASAAAAVVKEESIFTNKLITKGAEKKSQLNYGVIRSAQNALPTLHNGKNAMQDDLSGISGGIEGLLDPLSEASKDSGDGGAVGSAGVQEDTGDSGLLAGGESLLEGGSDDGSSGGSAGSGAEEPVEEAAAAPDGETSGEELVLSAAKSSGTSETTSTGTMSMSMESSAESSSMESMEMSGPHGGGHMAALDLVSHAAATHVAVQDGDWFDPATWGGQVPGAGARVVVPDGMSVVYNGMSAAEIATIRVDGVLSFPSETDTALSVDTIVVAPGGSFQMGSAEAPVSASAVITFVNVDGQHDPTQVGLGLVGMPGRRWRSTGKRRPGGLRSTATRWPATIISRSRAACRRTGRSAM